MTEQEKSEHAGEILYAHICKAAESAGVLGIPQNIFVMTLTKLAIGLFIKSASEHTLTPDEIRGTGARIFEEAIEAFINKSGQ